MYAAYWSEEEATVEQLGDHAHEAAMVDALLVRSWREPLAEFAFVLHFEHDFSLPVGLVADYWPKLLCQPFDVLGVAVACQPGESRSLYRIPSRWVIGDRVLK